MLTLRESSIRNVLGCGLLLLAISACAKTPAPVETPPEIVERVVVKTQPVATPKPIVPPVDQLRMRDVKWVVITPENIDEQFAKITTGEVVLFAVTAQGYENLALNLSDVRANIDQYKAVIGVYERSFTK